VFFPDLPGCTSGGTTLREAALNRRAGAGRSHSVDAGARANLFPPSRLDDLPRQIEPEAVEAARLLMHIELREKTQV
jgi:hypothetical protein